MNDLKSRVADRRNNGGGNGNAQGNGGQRKTALDLKMSNARAMFLEMKGEFATALPRHIGVDRFMRMALTCVRKNPALLDCEPASILAALMEAARLGLEPGTKQAAIVPFGKQATFVAQWQGLVELMYRSGQIGSVVAEFIHERDEWEYIIGDGGGFRHRPNLLAEDRGPIILAYAFATLKDGSRSKIVILTKRDAIEVRDRFSKNFQRAERNRREDAERYAQNPDWGKFNSTWHTDFDAMWRKSAVRRLADWVPQSPELLELMAKENEAGEMQDAADVIVPDSVLEGELVNDEEPTGNAPAAAEPGSGTDGPPADDWPETPKPGEG